MLKADLVGARFVSSDMKNFQGTRSELKSQLAKGWTIASGSNGSYILARPSEAWFSFKTKNGVYRYNLRRDILNYFNMQRLTEKAFKNFRQKLQNEEITLYVLDDGNYEIFA